MAASASEEAAATAVERCPKSGTGRLTPAPSRAVSLDVSKVTAGFARVPARSICARATISRCRARTTSGSVLSARARASARETARSAGACARTGRATAADRQYQEGATGHHRPMSLALPDESKMRGSARRGYRCPADAQYSVWMRVLLIEDYEPLARSLALGLREAGYAVDVDRKRRRGTGPRPGEPLRRARARPHGAAARRSDDSSPAPRRRTLAPASSSSRHAMRFKIASTASILAPTTTS